MNIANCMVDWVVDNCCLAISMGDEEAGVWCVCDHAVESTGRFVVGIVNGDDPVAVGEVAFHQFRCVEVSEDCVCVCLDVCGGVSDICAEV